MKSTTNAILKYDCIQCGYSTPQKWVYDNHLKSKKHLAMQTAETANVFQYACTKCSKKYKTSCGLRRHRVLCNSSENEKLEKEKEQSNLIFKIKEELQKEMKDQMKDLLKEEFMQEMKKEMKSQLALQPQPTNSIISPPCTNTVLDISANIANTAITNNVKYHDSHNTSIYNHVHVHLNTHYNDVINIKDFIDKIEFTKEDMEHISGKNGAIHELIGDIFKKKLQDVSAEQRPLHCVTTPTPHDVCGSPAIFIRDENQWKEEDAEKTADDIRHEVEDDDSDMEDEQPEQKEKSVLHKATKQLTKKMHDDCNEIYPPGYERERAQKAVKKGGWPCNRGSLVDSFVHMEELDMNQEAVPGGRLNSMDPMNPITDAEPDDECEEEEPEGECDAEEEYYSEDECEEVDEA